MEYILVDTKMGLDQVKEGLNGIMVKFFRGFGKME